MEHLCMAAAECGYKEIDQQRKEQFIHGLNNRVMLDEIIRELTSKTNTEQMTSKDVLVWAKRVKAQMVQPSVLNDITETTTFDKIKNAPELKNSQERIKHCNTPETAMQVLWGGHACRQCPAYGKTCAACSKMGHFSKVCRSKRNHAVHEVEIDMGPDSQEEDIEIVSINSLCLNRKWSLIMAQLEMQVGETSLEILYKIDTGSEDNLMPLYIF